MMHSPLNIHMNFPPEVLRILCALFSLILGTLAQAQTAPRPMITEIMFHPSGSPEPLGQEWLELTNAGSAPLDLSGALFDKGIEFLFPPGTVVPAQGRLIIAANPVLFSASFPNTTSVPVLGPWTGSLSNTGETIRLSHAGVTLASVGYSTEGDWAQRAKRQVPGGSLGTGWVWETMADGLGHTLEMRNPSFPPSHGQNWGASTQQGGTPGEANSLLAADLAPFISEVTHHPAIPKDKDAIYIQAEITDPSTTALTATLYWRFSNASPLGFKMLPMDRVRGSATFSASIGAQAQNSLIEFYVSASDGQLTRTWPASTVTNGQAANCFLQVENTSILSWPSYRLLMAVPEATAFAAQSTASDAETNATFIGDDGSGPIIRYQAGLRYRGASSRNRTPAPLRVQLPADLPWHGDAKLNLNSQYTWLQFLGMKFMEASGVRAPETRRIQLRINGSVRAAVAPSIADYGSMVHVEPLSDDFVDRHFPGDNAGNLYKKVRPDNDWAYRSGNVAAYLNDGWGKANNTSANQWTDLDNLLRVLRDAPLSPETHLEQIRTVADIDQWVRWFAVQAILTNGETNPASGVDDDYSIYFSAVDQRARLVPHDMDTILGQGDQNRIANTQHTLFDSTDNANTLGPLIPILGNNAGGGLPAVRRLYFEELRNLCLTVFAKPRYDAFLDTQLAAWVPVAKVAELKTFMDGRRSFILLRCATELGVAPPPTLPTTLSSLTRPASPLRINEVVAKNSSLLPTVVPTATVFPDYVELHNATITDLTLDGFCLTNDPGSPLRYPIPAGTVIPAGGYLLFYGGALTGTPRDLGFPLDQDGGQLLLYDANVAVPAEIDRINYGPQITDHAIGRSAANSELWTLLAPTPGTVNGEALPLGDPTSLTINEWQVLEASISREDFIEIYNNAALPVAMGGIRITPDSINAPTAHLLPALSFVGAKSFPVFRAVGASADPQNFSEMRFKLRSDLGWITVNGANDVLIDQLHYPYQVPHISTGRAPDGGAANTTFTVPTPGLANATAALLNADPAYLQAAALLKSIRITEIMYNPGSTPTSQAEEFIEIRNISNEPVDLTGLRFSEGIQSTLTDFTLGAGAYGLIVADIAAFEAKYGPNLPIIGETLSSLSNSGEFIQLQLPAPFRANVQGFTYNDKWHSTTDGAGYSLTIVNPHAPAADWDVARGWMASSLQEGTPGASDGPPIITSPRTVSATRGIAFNYQITAANEPTTYSALNLPTGITLTPNTGLISGTPGTLGTFTAILSATNSQGSTNGSLTIVVEPPPVPLPVFTSALSGSATRGRPFTGAVTISNTATAISAAGLPAGINFRTLSTGMFPRAEIFGTPTVTGTFTIIISATNTGGTVAANYTLVVSIPPPIVITSAVTLTVAQGGLTYIVTTTGFPTSITAEDLPAGLSFFSGILSGDALPGTYNIRITAADSSTSDTKTLVLRITPFDYNRAVDNPRLTFTSGGDAPWFISTSNFSTPPESIHSGLVFDGRQSWIETTVTGPTHLIFDSFFFNPTNQDSLIILLDDAVQKRVTEDTGWVREQIKIPLGTHRVRWLLSTAGNSSTGAGGRVEIDNVRTAANQATPILISSRETVAIAGSVYTYQIETAGPVSGISVTDLPPTLRYNAVTRQVTGMPPEGEIFSFNVVLEHAGNFSQETVTALIPPLGMDLAEGGDGVGLGWQHLTYAHAFRWKAQRAVTHDGVDALEANFDFNHNGSRFQTMVMGPGTIDFWWKSRSNLPGPKLTLLLDSVPQTEWISGDTDWIKVSKTIPPGPHAVAWDYADYGTIPPVDSSGFVDEINYTPQDGDNDQLGDGWEQQFFNGLTSRPQDDPDLDGSSNLAEFAAGTDPLNQGSAMTILQPGYPWNLLQWSGAPFRAYQLEFSRDLRSWYPQENLFMSSTSQGGDLIEPSRTISLISESAPIRALVPAPDDTSTSWRGADEDVFARGGGDRAWLMGFQGVGFDNLPQTPTTFSLLPYISLDLQDRMLNTSTSLYIRIPFEVTEVNNFMGLTLSFRPTDGYVFYLNGKQIGSYRFLGEPTAASVAMPPNLPLDFLPDYADIIHRGDLVEGKNILAIHAMSEGLDDLQFLSRIKLVGIKVDDLSVTPTFYWRLRSH